MSPIKRHFVDKSSHITYSPVRSSPLKYSSPRNRIIYEKSYADYDGVHRNEIGMMFRDLIDMEQKLESTKESLALRPDFTLHDAFKAFDYARVGKIAPGDVKIAFDQYGIFISMEDAILLVSKFAKFKEIRSFGGKLLHKIFINYIEVDSKLRMDLPESDVTTQTLGFDEFARIFLPLDKISGAAICERSERYPYGYYTTTQILDPVTRSDFVKVLTLTLDLENHIQRIRQKLAIMPLVNKLEVFDAINELGPIKITENEYESLIAKHRFF